ncbi:MAG TPA: Npun_F0494 family protein [Candidatus Obscuribacterales bacterium]
MTSVKSNPIFARYPRRTILRAERAVRCSPFSPALFFTMSREGVALGAIAGESGCRLGYTRRPVAELVAESELLWLIQVGMLRREVDGQGLTDSFRLTPLGRLLLDQWHSATTMPPPSWVDRILNTLSRWIRWSEWLQ